MHFPAGNAIIIRHDRYGRLVKRSRRRPLTAETGVRFPYRPAILKTSDMIRGFFVSKNPDPVPKKSRIFTELMFTTQDLFASSHAESPRLAQDLDESGKSPVSLCHHEKREVPCFPVISPKREDSCSGRSIFFADLSFVRTDTLSPFQSNISGIAAGAQTGRARISRSVRLMCTRRSA